MPFFVSCSVQEDTGGDLTSKPSIIKFAYTPQEITDLISASNSAVAHRGAWRKNNLPENSLESLKEAVRLKCKGSEFDIVFTADDSLVVNHDSQYNNFDIQTSRYTDLISLKLVNGEKIPTLREFIIAGMQNNTTTKLFCELKNYSLSSSRKYSYVLAVLSCVEKLKAHQFMVYTCFDYDMLKHIRSIDAYANIQYLGGDVSPLQLKSDGISAADYKLSVFYKDHPEWIQIAKENGVFLNVWTIYADGYMDWCLKNKFDYLTTDEPELQISKQTKK
ncbi:Glycerophosphoryl diester phosphodiesterase family protein [compost metagenome]